MSRKAYQVAVADDVSPSDLYPVLDPSNREKVSADLKDALNEWDGFVANTLKNSYIPLDGETVCFSNLEHTAMSQNSIEVSVDVKTIIVAVLAGLDTGLKGVMENMVSGEEDLVAKFATSKSSNRTHSSFVKRGDIQISDLVTVAEMPDGLKGKTVPTIFRYTHYFTCTTSSSSGGWWFWSWHKSSDDVGALVAYTAELDGLSYGKLVECCNVPDMTYSKMLELCMVKDE